MSNEQPNRDAVPAQPLPSPLLAELKAQCERLQQVIQGLEEERRREAETLAAAQAELNQFRQYVYAWARKQTRVEDWQNFAEADYTIPLEETLAELERQAGS
jgi:hypothetical protein